MSCLGKHGHKDDQRDHWGVPVMVTGTLIALMASSGIQLAYVAGAGNKFSLMFQSQAGKAVAIIIWSLIFLWFTWCGGEKATNDNKGRDVQFAYKKDYRNLAIGFFVLMISLIQFGNPLLALLYLGDDGLNTFINENNDGSGGNIKYPVSTDALFNIVGGINCYCTGYGAALVGFAIFQRCNRPKPE